MRTRTVAGRLYFSIAASKEHSVVSHPSLNFFFSPFILVSRACSVLYNACCRLTLLSTSPVGGLEAQDFDGQWISVPHVEGSTIVNFGQQVENLTGGIVQSATHRVVFPSTAAQTRYSVAWFSFPALNALLKPLDVAGEFSDEVLALWKEAETRRQGKGIVSDVPKGDLFASQNERFGWIAWRGLVRSHPGVVKRFYSHANTL